MVRSVVVKKRGGGRMCSWARRPRRVPSHLEAGGVERLDELQPRLLEEGGVGAGLLRLLEHHARVVDDGVGLVGPEVSGVSVHSDAGRRLVGCGGRRTGTAR